MTDSQQTARMNRARLAAAEREAVMVEETRKANVVRENMTRLRELRLAKEAQEVLTDIAKENQSAKTKQRRRRFR